VDFRGLRHSMLFKTKHSTTPFANHHLGQRERSQALLSSLTCEPKINFLLQWDLTDRLCGLVVKGSGC
jgi:hypothetical protein